MASEPKIGDVQRIDGIRYIWLGGPWEWLNCNPVTAERLSALLTEAEEMREVLRDIEFGNGEYGTLCPVCDEEYKDGHSPDCRLARLIGETR